MAFPDKLLTDDEQVVEHFGPHWVTLLPATLWMIVICLATGVTIARLPEGSEHNALVWTVLVGAVLLLWWLTFSPWLRWRTTHYVLTTERVLIRSGILRHTGRDIALARVNDVGFVLTLWDRVIGAGTILLESSGEQGQERLVNVPHAQRVQHTVNQLIDSAPTGNRPSLHRPPSSSGR